MRNFVKEGLSIGKKAAIVGVSLVAICTPADVQAGPSPSIPPLVHDLFKVSGEQLNRDRTLDFAAAEHLRAVYHNPSEARLEVVRQTIERTGDVLAHVQPITILGPATPERRAQLLHTARSSRGHGYTHFGLAHDQRGVVVLFGRRVVAVAPIPSSRGQPTIQINGRVPSSAFLEAWLLGPCLYPKGYCSGVPSKAELYTAVNGQFTARFNTPVRGWWAIELVVDVGFGPEVALLRRVRAGAKAPSPIPNTDQVSTIPWQLSDGPKVWIKQLRNELNRPPLKVDQRLSTAAQQHAEKVCQAGWALHKLPGGSRPEDRARAAGFRGRLVENVALASNLKRAWENIVESPAHRHGLLDPTVTHFGFGKTQKKVSTCLVMLLGRSQAAW